MVDKTRGEIIDNLIEGLSRLEYRGYDSTGIAVDGVEKGTSLIIKTPGKVKFLREEINKQNIDRTQVFDNHVGIAHTRWATHGQPEYSNCHPHRSDPTGEFIIVHNGIITNYRELKTLLLSKAISLNRKPIPSVLPSCLSTFTTPTPRPVTFWT